MSNRDALRAATLGAKSNFKTKTVTFNDQEFELRQPSIKVRSGLRERCTVNGTDFDLFAFLVWSVIECTYEVDTDNKVFDATDYDALVATPTGGFVDKFAEELMDLMNVEGDKEVKND